MNKQNAGNNMYNWASDLFPICRSLSGDGVRETLRYFQDILPNMEIKEVKSGTQVFDWNVPDEWNIKDAFIADESGERIIDFKNTNLHVMGYSEPVDEWLTFEELENHLYSLPEQPNAIPYITSYYKRRWGFCLTENQRNELRKEPKKKYHVRIDSSLEPGVLNYGELIIPGKEKKEILLSTYVCHPSMANNELSGPVVTAALAKSILANTNRRYTYRILFLVETIGSITYLSKHLQEMQENMLAGFVLTCMGDDRTYSYMPSRYGNTITDRVIKHVLNYHTDNYDTYSFLERGSDERQYCSAGADLPVATLMRSKYGIYPEYHTSLDDMSLITPKGLQGSYDALNKCIRILEENHTWQVAQPCEPQLGKRGLYPTISTKESGKQVRTMMNILAYADGKHDLLGLAELIGTNAEECIDIINSLAENGLLKKINCEAPLDIMETC